MNTPAKTSQLATFLADGRGMAMLIYALLFFMMMSFGATGILALILTTFADSDTTPEWIRSHYRFQARTFWIGIVPTLLVMVLYLTVVPALMASFGNNEGAKIAVTFLTVMPVLGWVAARCAMGFNHLFHSRPYPNPKAWLV
ncbi:MAG: hypothetical protein JF615_15480 [Asticcacaulis sp.]|nr:hypothetical protein [Asticcacaulis sp.]